MESYMEVKVPLSSLDIVEKDIEQLAEKIILPYENRDLLFEMKKRVRKDYLNGIGNESFRIQQWRDLFESVLNTKTEIV